MKLLFSFFKSEATVKMSAGRRSADGSPRFYARALLCCSFFPLLSRVFFFLFFLVSVLLFNTPYACTELLVCVCVVFFFCKSPHHQYVLDSKLSLSLSLGYLISARGITTVFCFFCVFFFSFPVPSRISLLLLLRLLFPSSRTGWVLPCWEGDVFTWVFVR